MSSRWAVVLPASIVAIIILAGGAVAYGAYMANMSGNTVIVAAGDIADCSSTGDEATANLIDEIPAATVLTLGDNVYDDATYAEFENCYKPSWGRHKARTFPTPGNHEYHTTDASGYFRYFDAAAGDPREGYYSYNLGEWHIIALNSNCEQVGGCDASSPQVGWLKEDLAESERKCTLAYFHHPLFTTGEYRPGLDEVKPMWEALYAADADVVLNAHDHNYQRFAPQDPEGGKDPKRGIREFVVGTGGGYLYRIPQDPPIANTEVYNDETHGVLKLTLHSDGYEWKFVPVEGKTFTDSGRASCH